MNDFYLYVSSTDSRWIYPGNTANDFTIELPRYLNLEGNWEIALVELRVTGDLDGRDFYVKSDLLQPDPIYSERILRRVWVKNKSKNVETRYKVPFYRSITSRNVKRFNVTLKPVDTYWTGISADRCCLTLHFKKT